MPEMVVYFYLFPGYFLNLLKSILHFLHHLDESPAVGSGVVLLA